MIKIKSQKDLDDLIALPDWEETFLREWYLLSPSYIHSDGKETFITNILPTMYIWLFTSESEYPGIEFFFENVRNITFPCQSYLNPKGLFNKDDILFSFSGYDNFGMQCKSLYYQFLDKNCWGDKIRYGKKNIFDDTGLLIFNTFNEIDEEEL